MKTRRKQSGITLMEMTVVVAIVALLAVFGLPAIRAFVNSLESKGPAEAMIDAALSSARAIALKEQRYAGIRFQKAYDPKGPLEAAQYMIFIVHDPAPEPNGTGLANGFRAVEGLQPIKLPDSVGVMDLRIRMNLLNADNSADTPIEVVGNDTSSNNNINDIWELRDTTSFSIVFSPSGKLVIHDVRVRNRDGRTETTQTTTSSKDNVFNTLTKITHPTDPYGMFVQDDYPGDGFGKEPSRKSFVIYDTEKFRKTDSSLRWSNYLKDLKPVYINPYMGAIIRQD